MQATEGWNWSYGLELRCPFGVGGGGVGGELGPEAAAVNRPSWGCPRIYATQNAPGHVTQGRGRGRDGSGIDSACTVHLRASQGGPRAAPGGSVPRTRKRSPIAEREKKKDVGVPNSPKLSSPRGLQRRFGGNRAIRSLRAKSKPHESASLRPSRARALRYRLCTDP